MAKSSTDRDQRALQQLRAVAGLIETPVLARIYAYTDREGPVTVGGLVDELEIPQGTAYDYVSRLEGAGLPEQTNDSRPYEYATEAISFTLSVDSTTTTITPALVAAIARLEEDEDVEVFVERHGLDGLVEALE